MPYVLQFKGYRPSPRFDEIFWATYDIQQSAMDSATGEPTGFSTIETKTFPAYTNAEDPPTIDFTTQLATQLPGWYRVIFKDSTNNTEETAPVLFTSESFRPTTRDVAVHIKNRTVDENNNYVGDFTSATAVTADEVDELIVKAEERILRKLDVDPNEAIPTESRQAVSDLVALYAAMLVELTKFGEQIQANRSPYIHLRDLFNEQFKEVLVDVRGEQAVTNGGGSLSVWDIVANQDNTPQWEFPDPETVNWESKF